MNFKINRDHFGAGLQLVASVVGVRKTMPILQNVLVEAKDGFVNLTTTNLDLGIRCAVKANVLEMGSVTLPVKELGRIVRELAEMEVNVSSTSLTKTTISTRGSVFNIIGMESKEFPPLPILENARNFELGREELANMLKSVSYAQSVNEERYMLKGVFFSLENDNGISLVATDGRRLGVSNKSISVTEEQCGEFILPSLTVAEIERLPKVSEKVNLHFTDRQVAIKLSIDEEASNESLGFTDSVYLVSKVVEGKYPNFKQVIPNDDFFSANIERELMLECVHRAALVCDEKVTLKLKSGELEIFGQSTLGDACESMNIDYENQETIVSFNPKFLLDPLKSISADTIVFEFRDEMSPGVFKVVNQKTNKNDFLCVVMPIRTD